MHTTLGENMLSFEQVLDESATPTPTEPSAVQETPSSAAARMLELAAVTADRLVTEAEAEAESLVTKAQSRAEAIVETSRDEADRVAAELARTREEQAAELDRERATALDGLTEEKAALEAQIASLRQLESDHRSQMRRHLTEHLSMLDTALPEPPVAIAG